MTEIVLVWEIACVLGFGWAVLLDTNGRTK